MLEITYLFHKLSFVSSRIVLNVAQNVSKKPCPSSAVPRPVNDTEYMDILQRQMMKEHFLSSTDDIAGIEHAHC